MDLFKRLDRFCNDCDRIQDKSLALQSVAVSKLRNAVEQSEEIRRESNALQNEFRQLDALIKNLDSEFFAGQLQEIKEKFEHVQKIYIRVSATVKGQVEAMRLYHSLYTVTSFADSEVNLMKERLPIISGDESSVDAARRKLEKLWLKLACEQRSLEDLNTLLEQVQLSVRDQNDHEFLLPAYLQSTLRDIESMWRQCGGLGDLDDAVKDRREIFLKQKSLEKIYKELSSYLAGLEEEFENAEDLSESLQTQERLYKKITEDIDRNRSGIQNLLKVAIDSDWDDPGIRRLSGDWFRLEETVRRRRSSLLTDVERYNNYVQARDAVKDELERAQKWTEEPSEAVDEIENVLRKTRNQEHRIRILRRESLKLQETLAQSGSPLGRTRQRNFVEEAQQLEARWKRLRDELEAWKINIMSQSIDDADIDCRLRKVEQWYVDNAGVFELLRNAARKTPKLADTLVAIYESLRDHVHMLEDVGRVMDRVKSSDAQNVRIRYLDSKSKLAILEDGVSQMNHCLERLENFELWLGDYEIGANAAPRVASDAAEKWAVYNNLKWQLDYGLSRELTIQQLQDQQANYPALTHHVGPVAERYFRIINGLRRDCDLANQNAQQHDKFDVICEKCNIELTHLEGEFRTIEAHKTYGIHVARERLQALQASIKHLQSLGERIASASQLADLIVSQTSPKSAAAVKSYADELRKRFELVQEKANALRKETETKFDSLDRCFCKLDDLSSWLRDTQARLHKTLQLKSTEQEKIQDLAELKRISSDLNQKHTPIEEVRHMANTLSDEQFQSKARPLLKELDTLQSQIKLYIQTWETYVQHHTVYVKALRTLQDFIAQLDVDLKDFDVELQYGVSNNNLPQLEDAVSKVKEQLSQALKQQLHLSDIARSLNTETSKQGREQVRIEVRDLRDTLKSYQSRLDKMCDQLHARKLAAERPSLIFATKPPEPYRRRQPSIPTCETLSFEKSPAGYLSTKLPERGDWSKDKTPISSAVSSSLAFPEISSTTKTKTIEVTRGRKEIQIEKRTVEEIPVSKLPATATAESQSPSRLKSPVVTDISGGSLKRPESTKPEQPISTGFTFSDKTTELRNKILQYKSTLSETGGATVRTTTRVTTDVTNEKRSTTGQPLTVSSSLTVDTGAADGQRKLVISPFYASKKFETYGKQPTLSSDLEQKIAKLEKFLGDAQQKTLAAANINNCPLSQLMPKLRLLEAIDDQKLAVADMFHDIETSPSLRSAIARDERIRIESLQRQWTEILADVAKLKAELRSLSQDGDELQKLNAKIDHIVDQGHKAALRRRDCETLADKEAHLKQLKAIRRSVKDQAPFAHGTEALRKRLVNHGLGSLPHNRVTDVENCSQELKCEIQIWKEAVSAHNDYLDCLDRTNSWLEQIGPILAALSVKQPADAKAADAMLSELWGLKTEASANVSNANDLMKFALQFLSPRAQDTLKKNHAKMAGYWDEFLCVMIQNIIDRVLAAKNDMEHGRTSRPTPIVEAATVPYITPPVKTEPVQSGGPAAATVATITTTRTMQRYVTRRRSFEEMQELPVEGTAVQQQLPHGNGTNGKQPRAPSQTESGYRSGQQTPEFLGFYEAEPKRPLPYGVGPRVLPAALPEERPVSSSLHRSGSLTKMEVFEEFAGPTGASTPRATSGRSTPLYPREESTQLRKPDYTPSVVSSIRRSGSWDQVQSVLDDDGRPMDNGYAIGGYSSQTEPMRGYLVEEQHAYYPTRPPSGMTGISGSGKPVEEQFIEIDRRYIEPRRPYKQADAAASIPALFDSSREPVSSAKGPKPAVKMLAPLPQRSFDFDYYASLYYEDRFVRLEWNRLLIKTYCFPFWLPKLIFLSDIRTIFYSKTPVICKTPTWGCTCRATWWAFHCCRECESNDTNVVVDYGPRQCLKAFSVRDFGSFLQVITPLLDPNVPVVDRLL